MNTAQESNNAIKYIVLSIIFFFVVIVAIQNLFLNKVEQLFPYGVHGEFTEKPFFEKQNDTWQVVWKIPTQCQHAELVYFNATVNETGGVTGACTASEGGQLCRAELNILIFDAATEYKAQARNNFCARADDYFTSEVFTVNMNALSSGPVF